MPKIGCGEESDYIISLMLPSKDQTDLGYTELDKIYVVVLKPNKSFEAYLCDLPKPILV